MNKEERIGYLEEERQKIWEQIISLQGKIGHLEKETDLLKDQVDKKTSDYEAEAKLSAEQSLEYQESTEEAKNTAVTNLVEINAKLVELRGIYKNIVELHTQAVDYIDSSKENSNLIQNIYENIQSKNTSAQNQLGDIEKIFENKPIIDEKIGRLTEVFARGDDYDSKLSTLYKSITERKKEIDDLYYDIFGFTEKDESGESIETTGKKEELNVAYEETKKGLQELDKSFVTLTQEVQKNYEKFLNHSNASLNDKLKSWQANLESVSNRLEELLPRALTTGLSYAYSEKKDKEETERKKLSTTFLIGIGGLIVVSLIPLGVSLNSISQNVPFEEVILRIPRVVFAILPLYIPVLWVAYSSNKKMNLSKRLIEEYTHKEVLSKTFEGLAKQISNVKDDEVSADLKIKLLYNILEVNSENPGKLISDYDKSDHPLMDALDKSIKLTNAVTRLSKIPGFTKLASTLAKKSEDILEKEGQKAEAAIQIVNS